MMAYFNYHAKVKNMVEAGELENVMFVEKYKNISPALVLIFKNHAPMPIREYRFKEYKHFLAEYGFEVEIPEKYMWFAFFYK